MPDHAGRNNQLVRQWNILMKLASHRMVGVTVGELVEEHRVARRTIERDIEGLCEAGFPIAVINQDGTQKYWGVVGPAPDLPPFPMDQDELIAVWMASGLLEFFEGTPYQEGIDRLRSKLSSTLPPRVVATLEDIEQHFIPIQRQRAFYGEKRELVSALNRALLGQRRIRMVYFNPTWDAPRTYDLRPAGILVHRQILYLAALPADSDQPLVFSVPRIRAIEVLDERFELPEGFSLADRVDRHFGIYQGEPVRVRVRFDREVAHFPNEIRFHPTQANAPNADGSVDVTMTVGGLQEVVWWVLSYTDKVRVLEPAELAESVRTTALAIAEKYRET